MKITELRCAACDGTLKVDEKNPRYAECEYCHTRFSIEWGDQLKPLPKIEYEPITIEQVKSPFTWKKGALIGALLIFFGGALVVYTKQQAEKFAEPSPDVAKTIEEIQNGSNNLPPEILLNRPNGLLAAFAENLFGKAMDDITDSELSKIAWLEVKSGIDYWQVGYSYENPLDNADAELTWISFSRDKYSLDTSCLSSFTGLKMIGVGQGFSASDVSGLELEGIKGYFSSLEEVAETVEDPSLLRLVDMTGSPCNLQGIEMFPNLESLTIDADEIEEVRQLISATNLKEVSVDMYDGSMDFSVFGMMPWLESLTISSENVRDISFISGMDSLKTLNLKYGTFLTIEPLSGLSGLEELSLFSCDEVRDLSAISNLTGLKQLGLELPYNCPEPDLSGLANLEVLHLDGFEGTNFLRSMGNLQELTLENCRVDSGSDFVGLVNLKTLKCASFGSTARDYSFITSLPKVENLDLHGTATYDDISGLFNIPTLKTLNINGMECEINFSNIKENTTLEELSINNVKLYKNVKVSGGGGFYSVDWDAVNLTDHLDVFEKLKGLKRLSIQGNELTGLEFAASLQALESIDFSDNYVTSLSPISGLRNLSQIICEDNPISNYDVISETVTVIN